MIRLRYLLTRLETQFGEQPEKLLQVPLGEVAKQWYCLQDVHICFHMFVVFRMALVPFAHRPCVLRPWRNACAEDLCAYRSRLIPIVWRFECRVWVEMCHESLPLQPSRYSLHSLHHGE